jgi:uncharacterized protein YfbU (UPF0304 family)
MIELTSVQRKILANQEKILYNQTKDDLHKKNAAIFEC